MNTDQEQRKSNHICVHPCPSVVKKNPIQCREKHPTSRWAHDLQAVASLRPDSGLHPVRIDNPFNALDFRQPSLILNPQAGCLASTMGNKKNLTYASYASHFSHYEERIYTQPN